MSRIFFNGLFIFFIHWFVTSKIDLRLSFVSCQIPSLSLTSVDENRADDGAMKDIIIRNFWHEIFPLQFYFRKKNQLWKFTNPTIPMSTHLFKDSIEKLIEKEWLQYQKISHHFALRPDGYPSMGLLLLEHIILRLELSGTIDSLNIAYENDKAYVESQSCFGSQPFQTKLNNFLQGHFTNVLRKYIQSNTFVRLSINVPIRVHLVSTTITSVILTNIKPFRVIVLSASVNVKHFSQQTFHIPVTDESATEISTSINDKKADLHSGHHLLNSNYKAFMIYGEKPFQHLNNPQTNLDFKIIKFIHSYQELTLEPISVTSEVSGRFTCLEKNLYISSKFPKNSKSLNYCLVYPKRLNNVEAALIYLGFIPQQAISLHYRVFLHKNEWVKVPLIQTCTEKGWTPPQSLLNLEEMIKMYAKCEDLVTNFKLQSTSDTRQSVTMLPLA